MTANLTSHRVVLVATGTLVAAFALSGVAQAVTDTIFKYTTAKTGYFGIDPMALAAWNGGSANVFTVNWGSGGGLSTSSDGCYSSGVNLPNGATIAQLSVWTTASPGASYNVQLIRHRLSDGTAEWIATQTLSDGNGTRKQKNIAIPNDTIAQVDNARYTYGFGVCLDNISVFHAARVGYTYTIAGD